MARSLLKGFYINSALVTLLEKIHSGLKIKKKIILTDRSSHILPEFVNLTFKLYNGLKFTELLIKENMIGHKFGEFVITRHKFTYKKKASLKKK